jgi:1-acyl-sn-glycerol-3-phosphate acyltransferase
VRWWCPARWSTPTSSSRSGGCCRDCGRARFGKPLDFSRYDGLAGDRFVERSITDEIMYELMRLSGQDYVDRYAADVKKGKSVPLDPTVRELGDRRPDTRAS